MPCKTVKLEDIAPAAYAIVCTRANSRRRIACSVPQCGRPGTILCDHRLMPIVGEDRDGLEEVTCDRLVCTVHSRHVGPNRDFCLDHPE